MNSKQQNEKSEEEKKLSQAHDKFFREMAHRPEVIKDLIRLNLSDEILQQMDMRTLKITKDTHIDKNLHEHFSDLICSVKIRGKLSYIYFLFEHKSQAESHVLYQIFRNISATWGTILKSDSKRKDLPLIIPFVFYHGKNEWNLHTQFEECVFHIPGTEKYVPNFAIEFIDAYRLEDEAVRGAIVSQLFFRAAKNIFSPNLIEKLYTIMELCFQFQEKRVATEYLEILMRYLLNTMKSDDTDCLVLI